MRVREEVHIRNKGSDQGMGNKVVVPLVRRE
jgi:hypothetical protein